MSEPDADAAEGGPDADADEARADAAERRTKEALAAGGFADMRPPYRRLLRRLKESDAAAFEEAGRRYRERLVPAIEAGEREPIAAWTEYGLWLAGRLAPGRLVRLDETGFASPSEPDPGGGGVLLYLPDERGEPAIPILLPSDLSAPQKTALELLVR